MTTLAEVYELRSQRSLRDSGVVRDDDSSPKEIRDALASLARSVADEILERFGYDAAEVTTPLSEEITVARRRSGRTIVISTRADYEPFGRVIANELSPAWSGYMDFGSVRGRAALNAPIREISIPEKGEGSIDTVVVAKSVLATGCTAVSLARIAMEEYQPRQTLIATVFYSREGLLELAAEIPEADIFVVGDPDRLDSDGILHPGIGMLDERIYIDG